MITLAAPVNFEVSKSAFKRTRTPIGGRFSSLCGLAKCVAGGTSARRLFFDPETQGLRELLRAAEFVVTSETGQDGQARSIGTGPASGARFGRLQIEHAAAVCIPGFAAIHGKGAVVLVELSVVLIEHQHMAFAIALWAAFDPGIRRDGIRAGIALVFAFLK